MLWTLLLILLLAAIAAAWSMDIGPDLIAAGIKTFDYAA